MKKLKILILAFVGMVFIAGCKSTKLENVEGTLPDLMSKVYENLPEDNRPMMLTNIEINEENIEYYLGTKDIEYEEALASESGVGSIPHSVVLVRTKENADIESIKKEIKDNVDPRKWVCVEAENVVVKNKGNLIILIMTTDGLEELEKGFDNL